MYKNTDFPEILTQPSLQYYNYSRDKVKISTACVRKGIRGKIIKVNF